MTDTDMLYMASLTKRNEELEAKVAELEGKHWNECGQIAHYSDELRKAKELLKAAVDDVRYCMRYYDPCEVCALLEENGECAAADDNDCSEKYKWRYEAETLALIGEDTNVPASADDTNVGHKSGGWISCEDRLPEPDTMVIVASYGSDIVIPEDSETVEECCKRLKKECVRVTLGFIGSDGWYDCEYCPLIVTPSFWQPLPEPPKE